MKSIQSSTYKIEFGQLVDSSFSKIIQKNYANSKKLIFVDEHTHDFCLEYLLTNFDFLEDAEIILLPNGEENKVLEVCFQVWEALSEYKISRKDLIINLGGGVVTDMGGFIASVYKRGIDFIHVPTTLLAMVDASIGGKTGIDLGRHKNQLGVFSNPKAIFIDETFLSTLDQIELYNGISEMLKHGLIANENHWKKISSLNPKQIQLKEIFESVEIKNKLVMQDPNEQSFRKLLNFGHTFGHAIEGFLIGSEAQIAHGHAVALGMICETHLSTKKNGLSEISHNEIISSLQSKFEMLAFEEEVYPALFELMLNDKKNSNKEVKCVLLKQIGEAEFDQTISQSEIYEAFDFLKKLIKEK